jgi:hypothetical protein
VIHTDCWDNLDLGLVVLSAVPARGSWLLLQCRYRQALLGSISAMLEPAWEVLVVAAAAFLQPQHHLAHLFDFSMYVGTGIPASLGFSVMDITEFCGHLHLVSFYFFLQKLSK